MIQKNKKDSIQIGVIAGLLLPLVGLLVFSLTVIGKFDTYTEMIQHFQLYNVWYKILSLSLMPGTGLFFLWSKSGKTNQARGVLLMTLFYGVFVIMLYLS